MSSSRGQANHRLYLARILIDAWGRALQEQQLPAITLDQAYLPAVKDHLATAYGWFLLEIARPVPLPQRVPHSCAELPGLAEGRALPGEISECRQLEASGWLCELLQADSGKAGALRSSDSLAADVGEHLGPEQFRAWAGHLEALFDRMGDSLDES